MNTIEQIKYAKAYIARQLAGPKSWNEAQTGCDKIEASVKWQAAKMARAAVAKMPEIVNGFVKRDGEAWLVHFNPRCFWIESPKGVQIEIK